MKSLLIAVAALGIAAGAAAKDPVVERGQYLVSIGGCDDCHSVRGTPDSQRLTGSSLGFSGPWGVSYPANLRLSADRLTLPQWLARTQAGGLPPMPWEALASMTTEDRTAVYQYLRSLGPAGTPAPLALAPGQPIPTMHISFVPQPGDSVTSR